MPVPTRLVQEVTDAPTLRKKAWAAAYLMVWLITFHRTRQGLGASVSDLTSWADCSNRNRVNTARKSALTWLAAWLERDSTSSDTDSIRHRDSSETIARVFLLQVQKIQFYKTPP